MHTENETLNQYGKGTGTPERISFPESLFLPFCICIYGYYNNINTGKGRGKPADTVKTENIWKKWKKEHFIACLVEFLMLEWFCWEKPGFFKWKIQLTRNHAYDILTRHVVIGLTGKIQVRCKQCVMELLLLAQNASAAIIAQTRTRRIMRNVSKWWSIANGARSTPCTRKPSNISV